MNREYAPYVVAICTGVFVFVVTTPMLGMPPAFLPFAVRSVVIVLVATAVAFALAERRFGY